MKIKMKPSGRIYTVHTVNYNLLYQRKLSIEKYGSTTLSSGLWIEEEKLWLEPNTFEVIEFEDDIQKRYFIEAGL
jgi:hypothetical protein